VQGVGDCISCCEYCSALTLNYDEKTRIFEHLLTTSYNMIKKQMQGGDPSYRTSSGQHLLAAAEASESDADNSIIELTYRCHNGHADESYMGRQDESLCDRQE
jgi:hypothetical protein